MGFLIKVEAEPLCFSRLYKYFLIRGQQRKEDSLRRGNRTYGHRCVRPTLYLLHHSGISVENINELCNIPLQSLYYQTPKYKKHQYRRPTKQNDNVI